MKSTREATLELELRETLRENLDSADWLAQQAATHSSVRPAPSPSLPPGVLVGFLKGFAKSGTPEVDFPGNPKANPVPARVTVELNAQHIGCELVLVFEAGDPRKPIILGVIQPVAPVPATTAAPIKPVEATLDGQQVILTADQEIVLRCGKASITMTRAGKILISGEYVLSRSTGVNRIKGGSVQIN